MQAQAAAQFRQARAAAAKVASYSEQLRRTPVSTALASFARITPPDGSFSRVVTGEGIGPMVRALRDGGFLASALVPSPPLLDQRIEEGALTLATADDATLHEIADALDASAGVGLLSDDRNGRDSAVLDPLSDREFQVLLLAAGFLVSALGSSERAAEVFCAAFVAVMIAFLAMRLRHRAERDPSGGDEPPTS